VGGVALKILRYLAEGPLGIIDAVPAPVVLDGLGSPAPPGPLVGREVLAGPADLDHEVLGRIQLEQVHAEPLAMGDLLGDRLVGVPDPPVALQPGRPPLLGLADLHSCPLLAAALA
jgi:hypothetical protein